MSHRVFISYHHAKDQYYKEQLLDLNTRYQLFIDMSVDIGEIDEFLPAQRIREIIRDEYLRESSVTILLVGQETKRRKHIDWELYSSMIDGKKNKKSGILVINLPTIPSNFLIAGHEGEKEIIYPYVTHWFQSKERTRLESYFPYLPDRIVDNLLIHEVYISVTNWDLIEQDPEKLRWLIEFTYRDRRICKYDCSRPMRRINS